MHFLLVRYMIIARNQLIQPIHPFFLNIEKIKPLVTHLNIDELTFIFQHVQEISIFQNSRFMFLRSEICGAVKKSLCLAPIRPSRVLLDSLCLRLTKIRFCYRQETRTFLSVGSYGSRFLWTPTRTRTREKLNFWTWVRTRTRQKIKFWTQVRSGPGRIQTRVVFLLTFGTF